MSTTSATAGGSRIWKGLVLPGFAAALPLAVAVIGAVVIRGNVGVDGVNGFIETLSGGASSRLGDLGLLAPLGFAFAAGLASAFNPCGFAMLPAYLGLYIGADEKDESRGGPIQQLAKALLVGGAVTAGFVVLFGVAGAVIGIGARSALASVLPWVGLVIGVVLAVAGAWLISGGKLYTAIAARAAAHMGDPTQTNVRGYFLFGLSYGTASLSCTLPIFLSVIGTTFAVSTIGTSFGQFILYAFGMGLVIIALTIGMTLFKGTMVGALRKAMPYIQPAGSALMILAGSYIVFYWLSIGGLLD